MARKKAVPVVAASFDMGMGAPSPYPWEVTPGTEDKGAQHCEAPSDKEVEDTLLRFAGRVPGSDSGRGGMGY